MDVWRTFGFRDTAVCTLYAASGDAYRVAAAGRAPRRAWGAPSAGWPRVTAANRPAPSAGGPTRKATTRAGGAGALVVFIRVVLRPSQLFCYLLGGCCRDADRRLQKMRSDGNSFPSGRKVLTQGCKEAAAGGPA